MGKKMSEDEALYSENKALDDNKILRHLLFLQHAAVGHLLYGDDGERQCNTCLIDFNRDTPTEIWDKITEYNIKQHLKNA